MHKTFPILLAVLGLLAASEAQTSSEDQLRQFLFDQSRYNRESRPSTDGKAVPINLMMVIGKAEIDETSSSLRTDAFMAHTFEDPRLMWDPSEYGGIKMIGVDPSRVWLPDIAVFQETRYMGGQSLLASNTGADVLALIMNNGTIVYVPPYTMVTPCELDYLEWPMDTQKCKMNIGSWIYDESMVSLEMNTATFEQYGFFQNGPNWKLTSFTMQKKSMEFPGFENPYGYVEVTLTLQRKSFKYCSTFFMPLFVAVIVSIFGIMEPHERPQRRMMLVFNMFFISGVTLYHYAAGPVYGKPRVFGFGVGLILLQIFMILAGYAVRVLGIIRHNILGLACKLRGKRYEKPEEDATSVAESTESYRCPCTFWINLILFTIHMTMLGVIYLAFWPSRSDFVN